MSLHPAANFLDTLLDQVGDRVKYGANATDDQEDPSVWDSGELVEWASHQAGADDMPDGTWRQYRHLAEGGSNVTVEAALETPGALLFRFSKDADPMHGMPDQRQVMISLGNGQVIDASGKTVRVVDADVNDFTHAAVIPVLAPAGGDVLAVRDHIEQRLKDDGLAGPPTTSDKPDKVPDKDKPEEPVPPKPETPVAEDDAKDASKGTSADDDGPDYSAIKADAVALRKNAHDAHQKAAELTEQADALAKKQAETEVEAQKARAEWRDKDAEALRESNYGKAAKEQAENLSGPAKEAKLRESEEHYARSNQAVDDGVALLDKADALDGVVERAGNDISALRSDAKGFYAEGNENFALSTRAIEGNMPKVELGGPPLTQNVPILPVPPAPKEGASEADIRQWVEQREAVEQSWQAAGNQMLKDASGLDDLAEVKRDLAVDADARAAAATANVASEEARITGLRERFATATDHLERMRKEVDEEVANVAQLKAKGDTAGADVAGKRVADLQTQEDSWAAQHDGLRLRIEDTEGLIKVEQENAREYTDIAKQLREEADRAATNADQKEAAGNALLKDAEKLDETTDPVTDALGLDIQTKVISTSDLGDFEVDIPGRDPSTLTPEQQQEALDELTGVSTSPGAPTAGVSTSPGATESSAAEADADAASEPGAVVIPDVPEPVAIAQPEEPVMALNEEMEAIDTSVDALMVEDEPTTTDYGDVTA